MKNSNRNGLPGIVIVGLLLITGINLKAQDWPRWRGLNQDGVSKETGLKLDWAASKPSLLWTFRQAGSGFSAPTIVGTTLYGHGAAGGKDFAFALNTQTGALKWKQELGAESVLERGNGPRGSVTIDGGKIYLIRGSGVIHCLSAADGNMIWQKDFNRDFKGKMMSQWGYSESPLVDGNLVICTPGGSGGTMVALDKNTGNLVWKTNDWKDDSGYSSAIIAEVGGIRQYIQQAGRGVAGISAKDGKLLWKVDYQVAGRTPSAVIPTPVFNDNMVYVTNAYGCGCMGIRLSKEGEGIKAETIYTGNRDIVSQHGGVVLVNGYVYGYSDPPSNSWVCQNMKTGEIVWNQSVRDAGIGKGSVFGIGDRLLCFDMATGILAVTAASPDGWKEFGRIQIPERTNISTQDNLLWTHPVVANGKLYLRDHDLLFCFDLK